MRLKVLDVLTWVLKIILFVRKEKQKNDEFSE
jgi:hypothetical protein